MMTPKIVKMEGVKTPPNVPKRLDWMLDAGVVFIIDDASMGDCNVVYYFLYHGLRLFQSGAGTLTPKTI